MTSCFRSSLLLVCLLCANAASLAQEVLDCSGIGFSQPPQGSSPLILAQVAGQAAYAPDGAFPLGGVDEVCIVLFNGGTGDQISFGVSDDGGAFELMRPAAGAYVLIASRPPLADVVTAMQLSDQAPESDSRRGILLRMSEEKGFASVIADLGLRRELIEMARIDQQVRHELIQAGIETPDPEIESRMRTIDSDNTRSLKEIVSQYGWPRPELVGVDGADAAFLILQHAASEVQIEFFPLFKAAYQDGAASGQNYALLRDRTLVGQGKPQIYGTQAKPFDQWVDGEPTLEPIADEANVDARRAEVGLMPLSEYRKLLKKFYFPDQ